MRLTSYTDFGLRALMRLAGEPDRSFTTDEIAGEFEISRNHLIKVVRGLAEAGYVKTQRGAAGGFRLAKPAHDITLGQVVRDLEQDPDLGEGVRALHQAFVEQADDLGVGAVEGAYGGHGGREIQHGSTLGRDT